MSEEIERSGVPIVIEPTIDTTNTPSHDLIAAIEKPSSSTDASLLGIPPELRDNIWKYALTDRHRVRVDANFQEPALLRVNRQVRNEAKPVFIRSNHFMVRVHDYDSFVLRKLLQYVKFMIKVKVRPFSWEPKATGRPSWPNLMRWCKAVWHWRMRELLVAGTSYDQGALHTICTATTLVRDCVEDSTEWKHCAKMLRLFRRTIAANDKRWLEGEELLEEDDFRDDDFDQSRPKSRTKNGTSKEDKTANSSVREPATAKQAD